MLFHSPCNITLIYEPYLGNIASISLNYRKTVKHNYYDLAAIVITTSQTWHGPLRQRLANIEAAGANEARHGGTLHVLVGSVTIITIIITINITITIRMAEGNAGKGETL